MTDFKKIRNDALEEAAQMLEQTVREWAKTDPHGVGGGASSLIATVLRNHADKIRALKGRVK